MATVEQTNNPEISTSARRPSKFKNVCKLCSVWNSTKAKRVHVRLGIGIHVETRLAAAGAAECFWSFVRCASIKTVQNTQAASGRAKCVDKGGGKSAVKRSHCLPPLFEGKFFIADASTQRDIILSMSHLNLSFFTQSCSL